VKTGLQNAAKIARPAKQINPDEARHRIKTGNKGKLQTTALRERGLRITPLSPRRKKGKSGSREEHTRAGGLSLTRPEKVITGRGVGGNG